MQLLPELHNISSYTSFTYNGLIIHGGCFKCYCASLVSFATSIHFFKMAATYRFSDVPTMLTSDTMYTHLDMLDAGAFDGLIHSSGVLNVICYNLIKN